MRRSLASAAASILATWATSAFAQAGSASASAPDWFARIVSFTALLISAAAFALGRYDKWHDRKSAAAARDPIIDLDITRGSIAGNYDYELKIVNRGDVSVQLISLSCDKGARLRPVDANVSRDGRTVDYNGLRIERGAQDTLTGQIDVHHLQRRPIELIATLRINEAVPRDFSVKMKRNLA